MGSTRVETDELRRAILRTMRDRGIGAVLVHYPAGPAYAWPEDIRQGDQDFLLLVATVLGIGPAPDPPDPWHGEYDEPAYTGTP